MNSTLMIKPEEFFKEKVSEAISNQRLLISLDVESYIVNLLIEFIKPLKLELTGSETDALDTPLAFILKAATEAPPAQRLKIFKNMGDISLYLAGFFQDYFNRKLFDINYYISMGSVAYENVAQIVRNQHKDPHFADTFEKLSYRFEQLVEVVAEVSESPQCGKPIDILSTYDRWTRTHSDRLLRALNKVGIIPIDSNTREKQ